MRNDLAPRVLLLVLVLLDSALAVHVLRLGGLAASFAESGLRPGGMVPVAFGLAAHWTLCLGILGLVLWGLTILTAGLRFGTLSCAAAAALGLAAGLASNALTLDGRPLPSFAIGVWAGTGLVIAVAVLYAVLNTIARWIPGVDDHDDPPPAGTGGDRSGGIDPGGRN